MFQQNSLTIALPLIYQQKCFRIKYAKSHAEGKGSGLLPTPLSEHTILLMSI